MVVATIDPNKYIGEIQLGGLLSRTLQCWHDEAEACHALPHFAPMDLQRELIIYSKSRLGSSYPISNLGKHTAHVSIYCV